MSPWSWGGAPSWHAGPQAAHRLPSPGAVEMTSLWGAGQAAGLAGLIQGCCSLKVRDWGWGRVDKGDRMAFDTLSPQTGQLGAGH